MDHKKLYEIWCENATEDQDLVQELAAVKNDDEAIFDRFYTSLKFGTAGLRGVIGAGTNRMNIYVVRQATQGLANYVLNKYGKGAVAISHDSRIKADLFMIEAAKVLAANGLKVYITSELQPTPVLSYLVRYFKCQAGIMVTASHNPAKYNGYKAYGEDGCQMTDAAAAAVYDEIQKLDMFSDVKIADFDEAVKSGMIEYVDDSVYDSYLEKVLEQQVNPGICKGADLKVVYTPLNGCGNKLVRRVLKAIGVEDVSIVKEQELPDGNFTTCPYPNPEIKEALARSAARHRPRLRPRGYRRARLRRQLPPDHRQRGRRDADQLHSLLQKGSRHPAGESRCCQDHRDHQTDGKALREVRL